MLQVLWGFPLWLVGLFPLFHSGGFFLRLGYFSHACTDSHSAEYLRWALCRCLEFSLCAALFSLILCLQNLATLSSPGSQLCLLNSGRLPHSCTPSWALTGSFSGLWAWTMAGLTLFLSHLSRILHCLMPDVENDFFIYFLCCFSFYRVVIHLDGILLSPSLKQNLMMV